MLNLFWDLKVGVKRMKPTLQEDFLRYLIIERGYSEKTKSAYEEDINDFQRFLAESGESDLLKVSYLDVRVYLSYLSDKSYSRNSVSRKIASLRSFYQYLLREEKIAENPFSYVHLKKKMLNFLVFFMRMRCKAYLKV